jgi:hypothetical protein
MSQRCRMTLGIITLVPIRQCYVGFTCVPINTHTRQTDEPTNTETIRPNDNSIGSDKINIDKVNQVAFGTNNYVKYGFW